MKGFAKFLAYIGILGFAVIGIMLLITSMAARSQIVITSPGSSAEVTQCNDAATCPDQRGAVAPVAVGGYNPTANVTVDQPKQEQNPTIGAELGSLLVLAIPGGIGVLAIFFIVAGLRKKGGTAT